jgi:hypothetical protein
MAPFCPELPYIDDTPNREFSSGKRGKREHAGASQLKSVTTEIKTGRSSRRNSRRAIVPASVPFMIQGFNRASNCSIAFKLQPKQAEQGKRRLAR